MTSRRLRTSEFQNHITSARLFGSASVVALACSVLMPTMVLAQTAELPGIVVYSDSRGSDGQEHGRSTATIGSAVTVVTEEQIKDGGAVYVSDVLRTVPGVSVNQSGSFGSNTQVRLRGAEGNHVLVLIDGIEVTEPSIGEFNFGGLLADNIERIEVLRGAQSALWGSNATAGVINIITKGGKTGEQVALSGEGGSFGTSQMSGAVRAGNDWARGALSATRFVTRGINISEFGDEEDGDRNLTVSFKGDVDITKFFNLEGVVRNTNRTNESDPQDFNFFSPTSGLVIDGDRVTKTHQLFGMARGTLKLFDDHWVSQAYFKSTDYDVEPTADGFVNGGSDSTRRVFGVQSTVKFETGPAKHAIIGLYEDERETFRNTAPFATPEQQVRQSRDIRGLVGEYRLGLFDSLFLTGAVRRDQNSGFDDALTYRATAAYLLHATGTRLHGSVGTGVTNPTFFEQFGFDPATFIGNPNLTPEKSKSWDVGIEQSFFNKKLSVDVTYFEADLEDEIVTVFTTVDFINFFASPVNLDDESHRKGIEVSLTARPTGNIDITGSYTYTESEQTRGDVTEEEIRRPKHLASLQATLRFLDDRARLHLGATYNGEMFDAEFVPTTLEDRVLLDDYLLLRIAGSYDISDNVQWFGRVENALDEDYEDVFSFNTPGVAAYTGVRVKFGD